jgi:hypothetical protein
MQRSITAFNFIADNDPYASLSFSPFTKAGFACFLQKG